MRNKEAFIFVEKHVGKVALCLGLSGLLMAVPAYAQTRAPGTVKPINQDIRTIRASTTEAAKGIRAEFREGVKNIQGSTTGSTTRAMMKKEVEDRNRALRETRDEARSQIKDKREERRLALIDAYGERMVKRLEATIERLEKLADRIGSRITKVKAAGGNTTAAESALTSANLHLSEATASITSVEHALSQLGTNSAATTTQAHFAAVRGAVTDVRDHIKEAMGFLTISINSLKGMSTTTRN